MPTGQCTNTKGNYPNLQIFMVQHRLIFFCCSAANIPHQRYVQMESSCNLKIWCAIIPTKLHLKQYCYAKRNQTESIQWLYTISWPLTRTHNSNTALKADPRNAFFYLVRLLKIAQMKLAIRVPVHTLCNKSVCICIFTECICHLVTFHVKVILVQRESSECIFDHSRSG